MNFKLFAIAATLAGLAGCGGQQGASNYPDNAAPAMVVIVDTDLAGAQLSVQDGDQVIAMMSGQHFTKVSIRPGSHQFSAGTGISGQGSGNVGVDVQPGQTIYVQVGGLGSFPFTPDHPGFATSVGRAEGSYGRGGVSLIPEAQAAGLIKQYTEQRPLPSS